MSESIKRVVRSLARICAIYLSEFVFDFDNNVFTNTVEPAISTCVVENNIEILLSTILYLFVIEMDAIVFKCHFKDLILVIRLFLKVNWTLKKL